MASSFASEDVGPLAKRPNLAATAESEEANRPGDEARSESARSNIDKGDVVVVSDEEGAGGGGASDGPGSETKASLMAAVGELAAKLEEKRARDADVLESFKAKFKKMVEDLSVEMSARLEAVQDDFTQRLEAAYRDVDELGDCIAAHENDLAGFKNLLGGVMSRIP